MKKNTMITLEEELVKKAKALGINISEVTSQAVKVEMEVRRTSYLIPMVKKLRLRNTGPFKNVELGFTNGINIIYGLGGSGKSTIILSLAHAFRHESEQELPTITHGEKNGRIEIEVFPQKIVRVLSRKKEKSGSADKGSKDEMRWMCIPDKIRSSGEKMILYLWFMLSSAELHNAILFDNPTGYLADKGVSWFIKNVKKSRNQIIIATSDPRLLKIPNANTCETYLEKGVGKISPYKKRG